MSFIYKYVMKPVLFGMPPDCAHRVMILASRAVAWMGPVLWLLRKLWAHDNKMLEQTIDGVKFANPIGLSAGLDKCAQAMGMMNAAGFGFHTCGSVTLKPYEGNPRPWFHRLPLSRALLVYAGLPNDGISNALKRLHTYSANAFDNYPLVMSVAKTNNHECSHDESAIADYVGSLQLVKDEPRVAVLEINVSCPNTFGGEPFTTPERLEALMKGVAALDIKKPVWIKMPLNKPWPEFEELLKVLAKFECVRGVTIANLNKDRENAPLHHKDKPIPAEWRGNLSGLPTFELSNDLIRRTYRAYGDRFTIIGCGGVFSAEDAYTKIRLGASLIDMITGMIYEGPQLIGDINHGLAQLLERDGFSSISEAVGADNKRQS